MFHFKDFVAYFGFVHCGVAILVVVWTHQGFGKMKEEEGCQRTPSSAARAAHAPPLLSGYDGRDLFLIFWMFLPFRFLF